MLEIKQLELEDFPVPISKKQLEFARQHLKQRRKHTDGTIEAARELIKSYSRLKKVEIPLYKSALFHDCGRELPEEHQRQLAQKYRGRLDNIEKITPSLWHAPAAGQLLVENLGFSAGDKIVRAVANHTTGSADMNPVLKGLIVADFTEKTRSFSEAYELRNSFGRLDFNELVRNVIEKKIEACLRKNVKIHPRSIEAYNSLCD